MYCYYKIFFINKTPQLKQLWIQWILTTMTKLYPRQSSYRKPSLQGTHPSRAPILPESPPPQDTPSSRGVLFAFDALGQSSYFPCAQPLRIRPATSVSSALRTLCAPLLVSRLSPFVIDCSFHPSMDMVLFPFLSSIFVFVLLLGGKLLWTFMQIFLQGHLFYFYSVNTFEQIIC